MTRSGHVARVVSLSIAFLGGGRPVMEAHAQEPAPPAAAPDNGDDAEPSEIEPSGATARDTVLPCGLRVIAAQDTTLPVAAVILSLETGPEDDPPTTPGLTHALAYHITHGNRELAPGHAAAVVHNSGGTTGFAVGRAQVRYESLVPSSLLSKVIWIESQRLRAPTVSKSTWRQTLTWASNDIGQTVVLPAPGVAQVHGVPSLAVDGRAVSDELKSMTIADVASALATRFRYASSTLVVVAPQTPATTLKRVTAAFADLPARARSLQPRTGERSPTVHPTAMAAPNANGTTFAWAVAPEPGAWVWARTWCRTLNRQRRAEDDPPRSRVRCTLDADPRRGVLVVRTARSPDPLALLESRIDRISTGADRTLLLEQVNVVRDAMAMELRTPLALARRLSTAGPTPSIDETSRRVSIDTLTGRSALAQDSPETNTSPLSLGHAVRFVPPP